jgi:hypothetical protein
MTATGGLKLARIELDELAGRGHKGPVKRTAGILIGVVVCALGVSAQRAVQTHRIELHRFDSVVVTVPAHELTMMISGTDDLVGAHISRNGQEVATISFEAAGQGGDRKVMHSVTVSEDDGTVWEVTDGTGDGLPDYRRALKGPKKDTVEYLRDARWDKPRAPKRD